MSAVSALGILRQEAAEFSASLGYKERPDSREKKIWVSWMIGTSQHLTFEPDNWVSVLCGLRVYTAITHVQ